MNTNSLTQKSPSEGGLDLGSALGILKDRFRSGVTICKPGDALKKQMAIQETLKSCVKWPKGPEVDSGFALFATVKVPSWTVKLHDGTLSKHDDVPFATKTLGKDKKAEFEENLVGFAKQLLADTRIDAFMSYCGCNTYKLGIDYYPNRVRGVKKEGENEDGSYYHKDAYKNTTFILLSFFNDEDIWGPEWIPDLGPPEEWSERSEDYQGALRPHEEDLPGEIGQVITAVRKAWWEGDEGWIGRRREQPAGTLEKAPRDAKAWVSKSRTRLLSPHTTVAFFDPIVTHASPYQAKGTVEGAFGHDAHGSKTIRHDHLGRSEDVTFKTPAEPLRKITLAKLKLPEFKGYADAIVDTFEASRSFLRIEVRAPVAGDDSTSSS